MNLHRNNAAEWTMWAILLPFMLIAWLIDRALSRIRRAKSHG